MRDRDPDQSALSGQKRPVWGSPVAAFVLIGKVPSGHPWPAATRAVACGGVSREEQGGEWSGAHRPRIGCAQASPRVS